MKLTEKILIDTITGYTRLGYFVSNVEGQEVTWRYYDCYEDGSYCPGSTELNATSIWYETEAMYRESRIDAFPIDPRRAQELEERDAAIEELTK